MPTRRATKVHQKCNKSSAESLAQSKKTIQQVCWARENKKTLKETTSLSLQASGFFLTAREALIFILDSLFRASAMCNKRRKKLQFFNEREEKRVWIFCSFFPSSSFAFAAIVAHSSLRSFRPLHFPPSKPFLCCL